LLLAHSNPLQDTVLLVHVPLPVPLQVFAATDALSALQTLPQSVPIATSLHLPAPSHLPVLPHTLVLVSSGQLSVSA
jgi:hypothetical protein